MEELDPRATEPSGSGISGDPWSLAAIAQMTRATIAGLSPEDWRLVNGLVLPGACIDSRKLLGGEIFVPLPGARTDGHHHIPDAFRAGAGATLARRSWWSRRKAARALGIHLLVDDPLAAVQQWAAELRRILDPQVVAITGSSGKTTTKEMVLALLRSLGEVVGTVGNQNNLIGMPLTILRLRGEQRRLVLEMGTNRPGEIAALSRIARPDVAVITGIGQAHQGLLGGPRGVLAAKLEILEGLSPDGILVLPDDHDELTRQVRERWTGRTVTYGFSEQADVRAADLTCTLAGTTLVIAGIAEPLRMPLLGEGSARSALAALAAVRAMGVAHPDLEALGRLSAVPGRLQLVKRDGLTWLLDMYNASPEATESSLRFLSGLTISGRKIFVFGGMLELGEQSEALHRKVGENAGFCDAGVFMGDAARHAAPSAQAAGINQVLWCTEPAEAARFLREYLRPGDVILVKGARAAQLERVVESWDVTGERAVAGEG